MQSIVFLIPLFVFLYMIYRLVKDDYVFIRKGILPEQIFDITFFVALIGVFFARFFSLFFEKGFDKSILFSFFSFNVEGLSLLGFMCGVLVVLYWMGKQRKIVLGRFFDFFTLAFLPALTIGFFLSVIFSKEHVLVITLIYGVLYGILTIYFFRFLKPQLLSRTLKEGNISLFFFMIFSLFSLIDTLFLQQLGRIIIFHGANIVASVFFLGSIIFYFKQEGARRR